MTGVSLSASSVSIFLQFTLLLYNPALPQFLIIIAVSTTKQLKGRMWEARYSVRVSEGGYKGGQEFREENYKLKLSEGRKENLGRGSEVYRACREWREAEVVIIHRVGGKCGGGRKSGVRAHVDCTEPEGGVGKRWVGTYVHIHL